MMNKLSALVFVLMLLSLGMLVSPSNAGNPGVKYLANGLLMLWLVVFGSYHAWKLLLLMVHQLAAAIRGK